MSEVVSGVANKRGTANGSIVMWLLGLATTIALGGGSLWLTNVGVEIDRLRASVSIHDQKLARLEVLLDQSAMRLDRIETKLDILIEKLGTRNR